MHFPQEDPGRAAQHVAVCRSCFRSKAPIFLGPHAGFTPLVRAKNLGAYLGT